MAIPRVKTWVPGEVLTANDLENEFNNIANSALVEPFVASQPIDLNGQVLILDASGDTLLDGSTDNVIDVTIAGADDFRFSANTFTALSGSSIAVQAGNLAMTAGDVAFTSGRVLWAKGADVASTASITMPTDGNTFDITGIATITSFSATQAGTMYYARFTGAGLNLTYNASSMITPWARDYRTVPNEILTFWSLGSGNYIFWSVNGPKERVGVTIISGSLTAPAGYLDEDGAAVSRTTYSGLFAELGNGTAYGTGDGSTTFNTPDSRGRVDINVDGSANRITAASTNGANADTLGGVGGEETHLLTAAETPVLSIRMVTSVGGSTLALQANQVLANGNITTQQAVINTSGGAVHSVTQPWIAKKKYIRF